MPRARFSSFTPNAESDRPVVASTCHAKNRQKISLTLSGKKIGVLLPACNAKNTWRQTVVWHDRDRGYGGNQKTGVVAISHGPSPIKWATALVTWRIGKIAALAGFAPPFPT
jgi:hypothetical protein